MSTSNVLRLEDYRDRRAQRLRLAESLYSASASRLALVRHVAESATITGADRAAVVWVDEYGPGLVHPHVVLDLLSDRPRRAFAVEPLRRAWDLGVPGALDEPTLAGDGSQSTLSVALGSDGTRAWFLVAESIAPRASLDENARERIMFLAGECSAVVLHRDLEALVDSKAEDEDGAKKGFAGWPVLKDIEGREADTVESRKIGQRFTVARLARMLIDDDLTLPQDRLSEQAQRARDELSASIEDFGREGQLWRNVLDAFEVGRLDELATGLLELGQEAEGDGHHHGALEMYACAYDVSASLGFALTAIDSARFSGRVLRRLAQWDRSRTWYDLAHGVALAAGYDNRAAQAIAGLAVVHRERGNLPAARAGLEQALDLALGSEDASALVAVYLDLLSLEQLVGDVPSALDYGWRAVTASQTESDRLRCLAVLGGALVEAGEWSAAEDAWAVVAHESRENYYLVYAWDALAYLAALRGDSPAFEDRAARCDALDWENGQRAAAAEILYYRGLSYRALGRLPEAKEWLGRAVGFAEQHGFNRSVFVAEEALASLEDSEAAPAPTCAVSSSAELRVGLRAMRAEVGAGA